MVVTFYTEYRFCFCGGAFVLDLNSTDELILLVQFTRLALVLDSFLSYLNM